MFNMFVERFKTVLRGPKPNTQVLARTGLVTSLKRPKTYSEAESFFQYALDHPYMNMHECAEAYYEKQGA